ncbi:unnamed protein product [Musa acuminata subsp. malaccensis]|uniref:(wild Malaysian banana) hypothetical protein n=1 Tax=Musa acuminata subsp. malaccensis TaxID=214687 RepID=A0A804JKT1_MUSAM|nr:unnamed protein product [Musa acuminata subsp. malaccensis]
MQGSKRVTLQLQRLASVTQQIHKCKLTVCFRTLASATFLWTKTFIPMLWSLINSLFRGHEISTQLLYLI